MPPRLKVADLQVVSNTDVEEGSVDYILKGNSAYFFIRLHYDGKDGTGSEAEVEIEIDGERCFAGHLYVEMECDKVTSVEWEKDDDKEAPSISYAVPALKSWIREEALRLCGTGITASDLKGLNVDEVEVVWSKKGPDGGIWYKLKARGLPFEIAVAVDDDDASYGSAEVYFTRDTQCSGLAFWEVSRGKITVEWDDPGSVEAGPYSSIKQTALRWIGQEVARLRGLAQPESPNHPRQQGKAANIGCANVILMLAGAIAVLATAWLAY